MQRLRDVHRVYMYQLLIDTKATKAAFTRAFKYDMIESDFPLYPPFDAPQPPRTPQTLRSSLVACNSSSSKPLTLQKPPRLGCSRANMAGERRVKHPHRCTFFLSAGHQ